MIDLRKIRELCAMLPEEASPLDGEVHGVLNALYAEVFHAQVPMRQARMAKWMAEHPAPEVRRAPPQGVELDLGDLGL